MRASGRGEAVGARGVKGASPYRWAFGLRVVRRWRPFRLLLALYVDVFCCWDR